MIVLIAVLVGLLPIVPAVIYFFQQRRKNPSEATRTLVYGLLTTLLAAVYAGLITCNRAGYGG